MTETRSRPLLGLDLIRFAAAFIVMAFHLAVGTALAPLTRWGWVGVEVFFVLSGFVIAYTAATSSAGRFLRSRIVRLMPCVWLCGSATALVWAVNGGLPDLGARYAATVVLWPPGPWVDGVYWTLPVEVAFYAIVWLTLTAGAFRRIEIVFAALGALSGVYWLFRFLGAAPIPDAWATGLLLAQGCYFALGGFLWSASQLGWTLLRLAALALLSAPCALQIAFASHALTGHAPVLPALAVWIAAVGLIALSAWRAPLLTRWLGGWRRQIRLLGLATYPLYLIHDDPGTLLSHALAARFGHPLASALVTGGLAMAVAFLIAGIVEPPLQSALRAALDRLPRAFRKAPVGAA